ncbi:hypothetical protein GGR56DRAFT_24906 [Xylariaceae sp. FL0804]|nr:hypothetical protein GGR56DRAFT_24906 [Xylariaceae sp. FL0804]
MNLRRSLGHGHGHYNFHLKASKMDLDGMSSSLRSRAVAAAETVSDTLVRVAARSSDTDEKPASGGSSNTIAIALGICIPLVAAVGVLVYLHHRSQVRQRQEDKTDKFKSLDFGLEVGGVPKTNKRRSAFFGREKDANHKGQLSMDLNLSSPYLLPPNLQQSRESMNSLAKTLQSDDPYRPVASYAGSDVTSMRSFQKGADNRASSIYTGRSRPSLDRDSFKPRPVVTSAEASPRASDVPSSLRQPAPAAQPPQRNGSAGDVPPLPQKNEFRFVDDGPGLSRVPEIQEPPMAVSQTPRKPAVSEARPLSQESIAADQSYVGGLVNDRDSMAAPDFSRDSATVPIAKTGSVPASLRPSRKDSAPADANAMEDYRNISHQLQIDVPSPTYMGDDELHMGPQSAGLGVPSQENKRLSVGLRPLPPDDMLESEDPEFRANRIRSFYKEYFTEDPKTDRGRPPPVPQEAGYYEDYDQGYLGEAAYFDPETNAFVMPYAEPVTRRAMTPPPKSRRPMPGPRQRGPPGPPGQHRGMPPHGARPRAGSTMSGGQFGPRSPRPGSSASNPRFGGKPKKPLPPPASLSTLPTPSKLKDDSFALMNSIEFAPPPTFRDQAAGRSQSPVGERRPYQLNTPIHSPLVSAFDETAALPSPHSLRKSGTFTGLDFAPPRRFKDADSMSETGSIRSNRSGISTANLSAIRGGAGRVSRLPGDTVFTQAAMNDQLKPSWDMRD